MSSLFEMVGASFILVTSLMSILWVIYYFQRNAGIVDIGWALGFFLTGCAYLFFGPGWLPRRWVIALMVTLWSGRLAWHLHQRFRVTDEDPRYCRIRQKLGKDNSDFKFYLMFLFQGLLVIFLTIPFLISSFNSHDNWSLYEWLGLVIWLVGFLGETLADQQLHYFKMNEKNKDKVCQEGLWYYSRHPNYFFELVVWLGFFFFAFGSPGGIFAIGAPILMGYLLLKVSGVPMAEEQSLQSKGEAYKEYQKATSIFIPWFKKTKF